MSTRVRCLLCFVLVGYSIGAVLGGEKVSPILQTKILEAEYSLAKNSATCFILDTTGKKLLLKARGMVLKEWEIRAVRTWGCPFSTEPVSLIKKSALFGPKREKIKPGQAAQEEDFEPEALELADMPARYLLRLEKDIFVWVRPSTGKGISTLRNVPHAVSWYTLCPMRTVFEALRKKRFNALDLEFKGRSDSKSLYWAFAEGTRIIIF